MPLDYGTGNLQREKGDAMSWRYRRVEEFHARLGVKPGSFDDAETRRLRARLMTEEFVEYLVGLLGSREAREMIVGFAPGAGANEQPSLVEWMDGRCDMEFLLNGDEHVFGWDSTPYYQAVCDTNLAKAGGPRDERGKILKPPGWAPPDVAGMLAQSVGRR